ncbi:MAG: protoporphyrinogen oxidase, partial [candidate division Zixibacteria bacterium]|nr:protoporphyrinogen oxidase [candidate division Zixibacteria bacterium]
MSIKKVAVIGGGISGLAALHFLVSRYPSDIKAVMLEKDGRLGGTISTDRIDGYVSEWGPNGFLDRVPLTLQFVEELGISHLLAPADSRSGKRFIYAHGRLNEISPSPAKFMTSPLLSVVGRLRLAMEPFIRQKKNWEVEESVFDFAARRIGPEAARTLIDPMVSGIYGGDARQLSLKSCFPIMVQMEKEYGSLVRALIARMRQAKREGKKGAGPAGPGGRLTTFKGGLQTLIDTLNTRYSPHIKTNHEVKRIVPDGAGYAIECGNGFADRYDAVICSSPAYAAAEVVSELDSELSGILKRIPYASIAVICLGYKREDIGHDLDGFGFIVPRFEKKRVLGTIWSSSIFTDQAPLGTVQMRTMVGGATDPLAVGLSDDQLTNLVTAELRKILAITGTP